MLAVAVLMQLNLLMQNIPFTKKSQLAVFRLFLLSAPTLFFWGGAHSFAAIHINEGNYLFAAMSGALSLSVAFFVAFQMIFSYDFLEKCDYSVAATLQNAFNEMKNQKNRLFQITGLLFVLSFVPRLAVDWKLVFALTVTLFYLNRNRVKTVFSRP